MRAQVEAETEHLHAVTLAHAFITTTVVKSSRPVIAEIRDALEEDPLGASFYSDVLDAYKGGVVYRLGRAFR